MDSKHKQAFQKLRAICLEYNLTISMEPDYNELRFYFDDSNNSPTLAEYGIQNCFSGNNVWIIEISGEAFSLDKTHNFMEQEKE